MGSVVQKFITPLKQAFPLPKAAEKNEADFLKFYIEELNFYTDTVLEFSAKRIIASRETRSFPLVAECLKACKETFNEFSKPAPKDRATDDEWSPEAFKAADKLLNSDIGRRAADENWHWQLWDWMRKNRRWPNTMEAAKIKAHSSAQIAETSSFIKDAEAADRLGAAPRRFLGQMAKRRKELREIAYGSKDEEGATA
jgi:hypothetical protein